MEIKVGDYVRCNENFRRLKLNGVYRVFKVENACVLLEIDHRYWYSEARFSLVRIDTELARIIYGID